MTVLDSARPEDYETSPKFGQDLAELIKVKHNSSHMNKLTKLIVLPSDEGH